LDLFLQFNKVKEAGVLCEFFMKDMEGPQAADVKKIPAIF
jgi:hypothetical protein